jgi:peroxiredoxin
VGLIEVAVLVAWVVILAGCWAGYQLLLQNGRLALRVEALEERLATVETEVAGSAHTWSEAEAAAQAGLPAGTVLHDFELPDLTGRQHLRSAWLGQRWLLTFVSPTCPYSRSLLSDLATLQTASSPRSPRPVLVSTGPPDDNRRLIAEIGLTHTMLIQEEMEVGELFEVDRTPMAYLVDEDGRTASPLVAGRVGILGLAASSWPDHDDALALEPPSPDPIEAATSPAPINGERYQHGGLEVGSMAPQFRLAGLDGSEITSGQFRGRHLLLVFTDPICPPCDQVVPALERLHQRGRGAAVLLVARGGAEANRAWAADRSLTVPIALQARWDLSREFGILGTPVAFLLDERGLVAAPAAPGADAILTLAAGETMRSGPM